MADNNYQPDLANEQTYENLPDTLPDMEYGNSQEQIEGQTEYAENDWQNEEDFVDAEEYADFLV
jgi:hypothetical protein